MWCINIWEVCLRSKESSPTPGPLAQGSSARKIKPHHFWLQHQWGFSQWKTLLECQAIPLKEPTHRLTYSVSLPLSSSTRAAAWKAPVVYRKKLKCLALRQAEAIVPFLIPPPTEPQSWQAGAIYETPSIWLTLFDPSLQIPRDCAPPN